jgi:hypothetical protein
LLHSGCKNKDDQRSTTNEKRNYFEALRSPLNFAKILSNGTSKEKIICNLLDPVFYFCSRLRIDVLLSLCQLYYRYPSVHLLLFCKSNGSDLSLLPTENKKGADFSTFSFVSILLI